MLATQRLAAAALQTRWFGAVASAAGNHWKNRCMVAATTVSSTNHLVSSTTTPLQDRSSMFSSRRWFSSNKKNEIVIDNTTPEQRGVPVEFLYLNNLRDNPGAVKKARRIGRGIGCSKGKTSGRGHKGQGQRSFVKQGFEGGQTPLQKRLPARGMKARKPEMLGINLGRINEFVEMGRIPPGAGETPENPIKLRHLVEAGMVKPNTTFKRGGIKLLADGKEYFKRPLHFVVGRASLSAIEAVEAVGGTISLLHYNELALRQELRGGDWRTIRYRQARPPPKYQPYYTSWSHRGYLHPAIQMRQWFKFCDPTGEIQTKFDEIRANQEPIVTVES